VSALPLEARGLSHRFGDVRVLHGVDLALAPGRLLVVLGPNGAGKTTLLRILSGVLAAQAGSVALRGAPLAAQSRRAVARALAVVPQELPVPFPFRVRELVAMGRAPWLGLFGQEGPEDRALVGAALEELGLAPFAERTYGTLSGGEKQRVLLARARAQAADLLLLDEPTAHMDLGHRVHTFEWLRAWLAERSQVRAALLVTHDLQLGARFADEVLLMDGGRVVAHGEPADVLTPERVAEVYAVEATVSRDSHGRVVIVAERSRFERRFGYSPDRDEPHS
jgi:iron complex transport system ATP-binding protein